MTLKDFRKSKNLTQQDMAYIIGISTSMYAKIEQNTRQPGTNTLKKLVQKFSDFPIEIFLK